MDRVTTPPYRIEPLLAYFAPLPTLTSFLVSRIWLSILISDTSRAIFAISITFEKFSQFAYQSMD